MCLTALDRGTDGCRNVPEVPLTGAIGPGESLRQQSIRDFKSKRPVAFELRLAEPLIGRALMRKTLVGGRIAAHAGAFDAVVAGLDIEYQAVLPAAVGRRIVDLANRRI